MFLSLDYCPKCSWSLDRRPPHKVFIQKMIVLTNHLILNFSFHLRPIKLSLWEKAVFAKSQADKGILPLLNRDWLRGLCDIVNSLVVQLVFCHFLRRQCRVHKQSEVSQTNSKVSSCSRWTQGSDWTVSSNWGLSTTAGLFSLAIRCICFCCWWNWGTPWCLEREGEGNMLTWECSNSQQPNFFPTLLSGALIQ